MNRLLIIPFVVAVLGIRSAEGSNKFLLLNYSPDRFTTRASSSVIMHYVAQKFGGANQISSLKVGVACLYRPGASPDGFQTELNLMQQDLALAQSLGIPILVQVDTETYLPPSLLNWYDPDLIGYDPTKIADVEWYGWDKSTAVKLCWRNWGHPFRIGPCPNFLSTRFQAYEKSIYDLYLPVVVQWYRQLPADKKWLFVSWKCGWESALNGNYRFFPGGNTYYGTSNDPVWNNNYQPLGYNAAKTSGIKTDGILTTYDNSKIVGKHLTYLAKMAFDAGIPRDKISVHGTCYSTVEEDENALVNPYGNPGVSFYSGSWPKAAALIQAVHAAETNDGATGYGCGEFALGTTNYDRWLAWFKTELHDNPDCLYQALYNYDRMYGHPSVEQAMRDAMALYPASPRKDSVAPPAMK